jgi:hypothetical protein
MLGSVKGHTGRGTRKAMGQHAVNILDGEKERRTIELQSRSEKSLHYWVHMVSTVSAYADTYIPGIARNRINSFGNPCAPQAGVKISAD